MLLCNHQYELHRTSYIDPELQNYIDQELYLEPKPPQNQNYIDLKPHRSKTTQNLTIQIQNHIQNQNCIEPELHRSRTTQIKNYIEPELHRSRTTQIQNYIELLLTYRQCLFLPIFSVDFKVEMCKSEKPRYN